ncbi:MAG: hypothetical protein JWN08_2580, partial [Frankiales bacterium]|nr:hypothetical protein [Frankiales bacterium]
ARTVTADGAVADWLRDLGAAAVVVRPDRVVAAATDRRGRLGRDAAETLERLSRVLRTRLC